MEDITLYTTTLTLSEEAWDKASQIFYTPGNSPRDAEMLFAKTIPSGAWSFKQDVTSLGAVPEISEDSQLEMLRAGGVVVLGDMMELTLYSMSDLGELAISGTVRAMLNEYRRSIELYHSIGKELHETFQDLLTRTQNQYPPGYDPEEAEKRSSGINDVVTPGSTTLQ